MLGRLSKVTEYQVYTSKNYYFLITFNKFPLFRGLIPSLQYMIIYRGAYYGLFDTTAPYMNSDGKMTFTEAFLVGQVVTLIAAMTSYPLDTVRRRLMMGAGKKTLPFHNTISCFKVRKVFLLKILFFSFFSTYTRKKVPKHSSTELL